MLMEWVKKQSSSYAGALYIAAALLGAGLVLGLMYRKPRFRLQASAASGPAR
jgi:hypothetical protein